MRLKHSQIVAFQRLADAVADGKDVFLLTAGSVAASVALNEFNDQVNEDSTNPWLDSLAEVFHTTPISPVKKLNDSEEKRQLAANLLAVVTQKLT